MTHRLENSLRAIATVTAGSADPWWIIGSAAVALHGAPIADVADIDLLMSVADAEAALRSLALQPKPGNPDALFRSVVFGIWHDPPLPIEIMAGLEVAGDGGWHPVQPESRVAVQLGSETLYVPDRDELGSILIRFGRTKDRARARLLGL